MEICCLCNDCIIEKMWIEKGMGDNTIGDSYGQSSTENLLKFLKHKINN